MARASANSNAISRPVGEGLRLPTMAICGSFSASMLPATYSAMGQRGTVRSNAGYRGSVNRQHMMRGILRPGAFGRIGRAGNDLEEFTAGRGKPGISQRVD